MDVKEIDFEKIWKELGLPEWFHCLSCDETFRSGDELCSHLEEFLST